MNGQKQVASILLVLEVASAGLAGSTLNLSLLALSLVCLFWGYQRRSAGAAAASGLLLFYPLSSASGRALPGPWGFVASAVVLMVLVERLSFEYQTSTVLDSPHGLDEESRRLAAELSRSHASQLLWFVVVALSVCTASVLLSRLEFVSFAPLVAAASILLMIAARSYGRR